MSEPVLNEHVPKKGPQVSKTAANRSAKTRKGGKSDKQDSGTLQKSWSIAEAVLRAVILVDILARLGELKSKEGLATRPAKALRPDQ